MVVRLNRSLGILQSKAYYVGARARYHPTETGCNCIDWNCRATRRRGYAGPCKHMLAEILAATMQRSLRGGL